MLLRDAREIAAELDAMREALRACEEQRREAEQQREALAARLSHMGGAVSVFALDELTERADGLREELLSLSDRCDELHEELCEALCYLRGTRVS